MEHTALKCCLAGIIRRCSLLFIIIVIVVIVIFLSIGTRLGRGRGWQTSIIRHIDDLRGGWDGGQRSWCGGGWGGWQSGHSAGEGVEGGSGCCGEPGSCVKVLKGDSCEGLLSEDLDPWRSWSLSLDWLNLDGLDGESGWQGWLWLRSDWNNWLWSDLRSDLWSYLWSGWSASAGSEPVAGAGSINNGLQGWWSWPGLLSDGLSGDLLSNLGGGPGDAVAVPDQGAGPGSLNWLGWLLGKDIISIVVPALRNLLRSSTLAINSIS